MTRYFSCDREPVEAGERPRDLAVIVAHANRAARTAQMDPQADAVHQNLVRTVLRLVVLQFDRRW